MIQIDRTKCLGCGACADACFSGALLMKDGYPETAENCILCGNCVDACPAEAVSMVRAEREEKPDLASYRGVFVIVENDRMQIPRKVTYELLSESRKLADQLGEDVYAVDLCRNIQDQVLQDMHDVGCDHLILVEDPALERYGTELFSDIVTGLIRQWKPSVVLFPGTENGRDLAPRVSARLGVGLTADCTALEINANGELVQVRPTYGGNVIASIVTPDHRPQMASVRGNVFCIQHAPARRPLDVIRPDIPVNTDALKVKWIGMEKKDKAWKDVEEADIVLVGGCGVGEENFPLLRELALKLDAAAGATRKAVDEGWAPFEVQVGQTGKIIAPELCICFGVSGALQHTIGIRGAGKIIAVNNDPAAPIFSISDVAILGDCKTVLESLIRKADQMGREAFSLQNLSVPESQ